MIGFTECLEKRQIVDMILLLLTYTAMLYLCMILFNRNMACPSFLLTAGFWASSVVALINQDAWKGFNAPGFYSVTIGGVACFIAGAYLNSLFYSKQKATQLELQPVTIAKWKYGFCLALEIVILILSMYVVFQNATSRNPLTAAGEYYVANKYGHLTYDPSYFSIIQYLNIGSMYIYLYILLNNIVCKWKNEIGLYALFGVGVIISLMQGTRNTLFMVVISGIVMFLILSSIRDGWIPNIRFSSLWKVLLGVFAVVALFQISLILTGRSSTEFTFSELVYTYLGAPLKNLELYLNENHEKASIFGGQTFLQTYKKLYSMTNNPAFNVTSVYKYRWVGKHSLGNVYTMLMPLYNDFGLFGMYLIMALIGFITEWQYEAIRHMKKYAYIKNSVILYAYVSFTIAFAFFSNKYFETVVSMAFIYVLIGLAVIHVVLFNISVDENGIVIKLHQKHQNQDR